MDLKFEIMSNIRYNDLKFLWKELRFRKPKFLKII